MVFGYAGGMSGDRWLSVAEVARELGLGESTVRSMAATGRLPAYRPGRRAYLVDRAELREFIAKSRTDSGDAAGVVAGSNQDLKKTA
jgi:excisionase family DNA binding protein